MPAAWSTWRFQRVLGGVVLLAGLLVPQGLQAAEQVKNSRTGGLPNHVDLRPAFKKLGLKPRLQGKRGTCSVFTVAGALEYARASKEGKGAYLSVEFLNWGSNQITGTAKDGSFFSDLWKGFTTYGVCPEQDMPYQAEFDPNRAPGEDARAHARQMQEIGLRMHWIKRWDPNTGLTDKQFLRIKRILNRKWPVCGGFRWPKNAQWTDDVLGMTTPDGVVDGHSILLVGYRDDPEQPGGGVFIFRNSNNDGRDGYMPYEYAIAYMNDAIWIDCDIKEASPDPKEESTPDPNIATGLKQASSDGKTPARTP